MGFVKKTWKDRISQYPNRRTINDGIVTKTVTVGRDEGEVTQEGDAFSASAMNDLERRIYNAIEQGGGGGGGGGGHTIIDNEGVALTQRAGLQFKGAYSDDNETDGITEVNVVRNMTKAEFDLLTDNEKKGIINITDITSGSDDRFQPVIYSTEEREIGVWKDGKPLYEKTLSAGSGITHGNVTIPIEVDNIDKIVYAVAIAFLSSNNYLPLPRIASDNTYCGISAISTSNVVCYINRAFDGTVTDIYVTIRYTKTTDTAGSGTWTPQGVPAVHYSENEVVVGTWINGKTLYARTFVNENLTKNVIGSYDVYTVGTFDINAEMAFFITGALYETGDQRYFTLPYERSYSSTQKVYQEFYTDASGKLYILVSSIRSSGFNFSKAYITAYYTKIS